MATYSTNVTILAPTAATVTAANARLVAQDMSQRKVKSIQFIATGVTSGNGVFTVEVSNDGVNWVTYNRLVSNVTNTNAQNDTRVAGPTLSSTGSQMFFFPVTDLFRFISVSVAWTTDGTYSAVLQALD